jgi:hypothetical protein
VRTITLPWETRRAIIAVLREKAVPLMLEHADCLRQQFDRHGPDELTVRLSLTDDGFLLLHLGTLAAGHAAVGEGVNARE